MRSAILAALALAGLVPAVPTDAAAIKCRGATFGYAELTCETTRPARSIVGLCDVMNRQGGSLRWSRDDRRDTKLRLDLINAAGKRLCGRGSK
ncbi:hypothetical protein Rpal_3903 [Rhodopseudomonas palustris TIE-1]|uniref:hypothetical protein n=1 Tax=Rhodopseudomonas palustris TaxID=1076 RepID=UPI0001779801|nr:hypothetical protein [Rhodopseudomonas palustris]ACF02401.1 hypothetical protein Rpal_3903 [Rhodopseudomonas palustris TIE-1]